MLGKTIELKKKIQELENLQDKLDVLHGAYHGETCYMITCGPSINDIWNKRVEEILAHNLVVAVKQAYDLAPHIMDFHILNSWNYKIYEYPEQEPIVLMLQQPQHMLHVPKLVSDLAFDLPTDACKYEKTLALNRNFEDYLFTKRLDRPWGQGIMYELGIYLAVHLGVSELIVVGWDIGEPRSSNYRHFYDFSSMQFRDEAGISKIKAKLITSSLRRLYSLLKKKPIGIGRKLLPWDLSKRPLLKMHNDSPRYYRDTRTGKATQIYNSPLVQVAEGEIELVAGATEELYYWLRKKGIDLKVVSDRSLVHPCVPRIEL